VVIVGGGGFLVFHKSGNGNTGTTGQGTNGNGSNGKGNPTVVAQPATMPKCVHDPTVGPDHSGIIKNKQPLDGKPFAVETTPDGNYTFVTLGGKLAVMKNGSDLMPTLQHTLIMPGADKGMAFGNNGKDLIVTANGGAFVYSVAAAEQGRVQLLGKLDSPGGRGAVQDVMSPDGKFLFVTRQSSRGVAVFNYQQFVASGYTQNTLVGIMPTGQEPVGIAIAPNGISMYVTSMQYVPPKDPTVGGMGYVGVYDVGTAEQQPEKALEERVTAGCDPVRVMISKDGKVAWVTARESDALLGFDTSKMTTQSGKSLIARVDIGSGPIGETFARDGDRIVVADSNLQTPPGGTAALSIVDPQAALDGKPALTGQVLTGGLPRQFTVRGDAMLVTNYGGGQLLAINVGDLP
jgi:DNA-binding beta-propeller fold protein YncE